MYSHESLQSEGIDVLTFIDNSFDKGSPTTGYNESLYREHSITVSTLPVTTDEVQILPIVFMITAQ